MGNRLTKLDVTARIWASVFPFLSGVGLMFLGVFVGQGYWAGEASEWVTGAVSWVSLLVVYIAIRVMGDSVRMWSVLSQEPWVERRVVGGIGGSGG
ncbi:MAG TPA: hypothetical protein VM677_19435 [Actinokineospora sp.]|jgi:hypothetical protein|nr:hypothetical protein [Actinokineospora sp.]